MPLENRSWGVDSLVPGSEEGLIGQILPPTGTSWVGRAPVLCNPSCARWEWRHQRLEADSPAGHCDSKELASRDKFMKVWKLTIQAASAPGTFLLPLSITIWCLSSWSKAAAGVSAIVAAFGQLDWSGARGTSTLIFLGVVLSPRHLHVSSQAGLIRCREAGSHDLHPRC